MSFLSSFIGILVGIWERLFPYCNFNCELNISLIEGALEHLGDISMCLWIGINCQMTKVKQFSHQFGVLYSRENNPWFAAVQGLTSSGTFCQRDLGQERVL